MALAALKRRLPRWLGSGSATEAGTSGKSATTFIPTADLPLTLLLDQCVDDLLDSRFGRATSENSANGGVRFVEIDEDDVGDFVVGGLELGVNGLKLFGGRCNARDVVHDRERKIVMRVPELSTKGDAMGRRVGLELGFECFPSGGTIGRAFDDEVEILRDSEEDV